MKKSISLILSLVLCLSLCVPAFAADDHVISGNSTLISGKANLVYEYSKTQDDIDKELDEQLNGSLALIPQDFGETKTEYGDTQTRIAQGYAGNQVSGGYRFPTGGGFYFSDEDGPEVTVTFSLAEPWGIVSMGVTLGQKANSGLIVTVPNTTDYFKLYVSKTVEIHPYIVYYRDAEGLPWQVVYVGESSVVTNVTAYAVAVG